MTSRLPNGLLKQRAGPVTFPASVPAGRGTDPGYARGAPGLAVAYPGR